MNSSLHQHLSSMSMRMSPSAGPRRACRCKRPGIACVALGSMRFIDNAPGTSTHVHARPRTSTHVHARRHTTTHWHRLYTDCDVSRRCPNPHSVLALNTSGGVLRGFLHRGLCDTCPQVVRDRRLAVSSGQVSHNPKQELPETCFETGHATVESSGCRSRSAGLAACLRQGRVPGCAPGGAVSFSCVAKRKTPKRRRPRCP